MRADYIHLIPDDLLPFEDDILLVYNQLEDAISKNHGDEDKLSDWQRGVIEIFNQKLASDPRAVQGLLLRTIVIPMVVDIFHAQLSLRGVSRIEAMKKQLQLAKAEIASIQSSKKPH